MSNDPQTEEPQITRWSLLAIQVCVPHDWTDEQAESFADKEHPTGLDHGWHMRHNGCERLAGRPERVQCLEREGYCHIMLDC